MRPGFAPPAGGRAAVVAGLAVVLVVVGAEVGAGGGADGAPCDRLESVANGVCWSRERGMGDRMSCTPECRAVLEPMFYQGCGFDRTMGEFDEWFAADCPDGFGQPLHFAPANELDALHRLRSRPHEAPGPPSRGREEEGVGEGASGTVSFVQYWAPTATGTTGPTTSWVSGPLPGGSDDSVFFRGGTFWYDYAALLVMALATVVMVTDDSVVSPSPPPPPPPPPSPPPVPSPSASNKPCNGPGEICISPSPSPSPSPVTQTPTPTPTPTFTAPPCACTEITECAGQGGGLWGWGDNSFGQLEIGDHSDFFSPTLIPSMKTTKLLDFSFGWEHGIAVAECNGAGRLVCRWGKHNYNRLGGRRCFTMAGQAQMLEEMMQEYGRNTLAVAAGRSHSFALATQSGPDGASLSLYAWGNDNAGQLGADAKPRRPDEKFMHPSWVSPVGPDISQFEPHELTAFRGRGAVRRVWAGSDHSAVLLEGGQLYLWGRNNYGQCGQGHMRPVLQPARVAGEWTEQVALGYDFTVAIDAVGVVWVWGDNLRGQLGLPPSYSFRMKPSRVVFLDGRGAIGVAAGFYHAFAWTEEGKVFAWGDNEMGQLGVGTRAPLSGIAQLPYFNNKSLDTSEFVVGMAAGRAHSAAVTQLGRVYTWGSNDVGQLGRPGVVCSLLPDVVSTLRNHTMNHVNCGYDNTFAWA